MSTGSSRGPRRGSFRVAEHVQGGLSLAGGGGGSGGAWQVLSLLQRHTESIQNLWRVRRAADHVAILLFWGLRLGPILLHH